MILTMIYACVVATLLGAAAFCAERISADLGGPRRLAWSVALTVSIALPLSAMLIETGPQEAGILSLPQPLALIPTQAPVDAASSNELLSPEPGLTWPDWQLADSWLIGLWIASSAIVLLLLVIAAAGLRRIAGKSTLSRIGGQDVLLSESLGPAVFGVFRPRILLPRWLAHQDSSLGSYVLHHEREHLAARDQTLLMLALLGVASMPWNPALWWQLRRLRAAIEMDCDLRVLRHGADPREYSEALFTVSQQSTATPLGAVALTEPVSDLEQRISIMLTRTKRFSLTLFGSRLTIFAMATILALAVNAPSAQTDEQSTPIAPTIRIPVYEKLQAAQTCMETEDLDCAQRSVDEVNSMTDLTSYEAAQAYNFQAFIDFQSDETDRATSSYESILALPREELPDGLVRQVMKNVSHLYLQQGRYQEGLESFDDYLNLPQTTPTSEDYYLKSTILYQLERYEDAMVPLNVAIETADEPAETQYQLRYALQWLARDLAGAVETLEFMNSQWPENEDWAKALAFVNSQL